MQKNINKPRDPRVINYRCLVRIRLLENGTLFKVNDVRCELFNNSGCFPRGGSQRGKSSHDDEYGYGQEKRRPSAYVKGKIHKQTNKLIKTIIRMCHVARTPPPLDFVVCGLLRLPAFRNLQNATQRFEVSVRYSLFHRSFLPVLCSVVFCIKIGA